MNRKLKNEELNRLSIHDFQDASKMPVVLILDNIRSLHNIGSVFRTSDAFLVKELHLCGITAQPPHREIQKTALGATESVSWKYFKDTLDSVKYLKENGFCIIALEQAEKSIFLDQFIFKKDQKYAFVFGHEVEGVDQKVIDQCDASIEIPQLGTKHSFNISVSVGVLLWDFYTKNKNS